MKKTALLVFLYLLSGICYSQSWIRVNQIGYLEDDLKVGVWLSSENRQITEFELIDNTSGVTVYHGKKILQTGKQPAFQSSARLYFSDFKTPGIYYLKTGDVKSVPFRIGNTIYAGAA
ncbi:MAG: Cellulose 1,4-beta-cellobiosidase, partial [Bacteroidetes bacterium]|nr:Cellulose 1,4-beta-cellobiosidase [Bacteroidota bacterium]